MKTDQRCVSLLLAVHVMSLIASCVSVTPPPRPTAAALAGIKRLAVVVPPTPAFVIVQSRLKAAPGAVALGSAFGLLGLLAATVGTSASQQSADEKQAQHVSPHVGQYQPRVVFLDTLQRTVRDAARFEFVEPMEVAPTGPAAKAFDAVVSVTIKEWGLRLTPTRERDELGGFVDLTTRIVLTTDGREVWDEELRIAGQRSHTIQEYGAEADLLLRELTETLQAAGRRVAVGLLYPREGR
ncbi:MAG: hypothetical protein HY695_24740 [Deltaproteobacteria bacterium]|nr:hypothetical protein [Deltaproteobacteria bacterium]